MPTKDSESLKFIKYDEQFIQQGLADGVEFDDYTEPVILGVDLAKEASVTGTIDSPECAAFLEALPQIVQALVNILPCIFEAIFNYPNRRVVHLALHGKPRTRRKNMRRILRYYKNKL